MNSIFTGKALNVLRGLTSATVQMCVTSPPYWGLRDYGVTGQLGLEPTPEAYVARLVEVFREVRRVLKDDGTLWLNLGDSYNSGAEIGRHEARENPRGIGTTLKFLGTPRQYGKRITGLKPKDLVGIPWLVAFALRADGWYLRSDIIWHKPNPMPESVRDRPTKAHEYLFLLAKSEKYFYDADAVREQGVYPAGVTATGSLAKFGRSEKLISCQAHRGSKIPITTGTRNKRTVWKLSSKPFKGAHFATFPPKLIEPCILAGSRPGDVVLDPFAGAFTTALVAKEHDRKFVMIELKPAYVKIGKARLAAAKETKACGKAAAA